MRTLYLPSQSGGGWLDINMLHPEIMNMPIEFWLEFVAIIRSNRIDSKGKFIYNIINKINGISLIVLFINFKCSDPCRIINRRILKTFNSLTIWRIKK